ncbi:hypothetical protein ACG83_10395 [Frankia sp. R43]|uniref:hypothetical protein n=1 Tax=Frankia sp. R43 TaxID=269536 RepID=UPI0006C9E930|nr:hypothetical protein [Frankia sp. R43]KPM55686.1 hypothetical protein ACG83_10395 [Frankia sp. R43]
MARVLSGRAAPQYVTAAVSKALAAWTELNDRQQGTLAIIFALDQAAEDAHRAAGASGDFDNRPASVWPLAAGTTRATARLSPRWRRAG